MCLGWSLGCRIWRAAMYNPLSAAWQTKACKPSTRESPTLSLLHIPYISIQAASMAAFPSRHLLPVPPGTPILPISMPIEPVSYCRFPLLVINDLPPARLVATGFIAESILAVRAVKPSQRESLSLYVSRMAEQHPGETIEQILEAILQGSEAEAEWLSRVLTQLIHIAPVLVSLTLKLEAMQC